MTGAAWSGPPQAYVAGPMRGHPLFNFPAFDEAASKLRCQGWLVRSPAEHDRECGFDPASDTLDGFDMHAAMAWDIQSVLWADTVVLLPGWQDSHGVQVELTVARATGKTLMEYHDGAISPLSDKPGSPLLEAHRLVHGARQRSYGHPADDFARTGRMWGAILGIGDVDPALVGLCMAAVKISREVNAPKRDNLTDLAGYAETVHLVRERHRCG